MTKTTDDETQDRNVAVAIEGLKQQMLGLAGSLEEIKGTMQQLIAVDRTVAELIIHKDSAKRDIDQLWSRWEETKNRADKLKDTIDDVGREHAKFVNTFNGGMRVLLAVAGILQAATIGSVIWVFSHVSESDAMNRLQDQRILTIEQRQPRDTK